jgi:hypothetical protein
MSQVILKDEKEGEKAGFQGTNLDGIAKSFNSTDGGVILSPACGGRRSLANLTRRKHKLFLFDPHKDFSLSAVVRLRRTMAKSARSK